MRAKRDSLKGTAVVCFIGAMLAIGVGLALGQWRGGVAVALGLTVGALNGFLIRAAMTSSVGFRASSLGRLMIISAVGIGLGALLGLTYVPLVIVGIAVAQLVLAAVSTVSMVRA